MRYTKHILVTLLVFVASYSPSHGLESETTDDPLKIQQALKIVQDFSNEICGSVPLEGSSENIELSGKAKADLNTLLKKVIDLGLEGATKYQTGEYKGVLQADLAKLLIESKDCKLQIWNDLKAKLLPVTLENPKEDTDHQRRQITLDSSRIGPYLEVVKYSVEDNHDFLTVNMVIKSTRKHTGWIKALLYDEDGVLVCHRIIPDIACSPTLGGYVLFKNKVSWASHPYTLEQDEVQRGYLKVPKDTSTIHLVLSP